MLPGQLISALTGFDVPLTFMTTQLLSVIMSYPTSQLGRRHSMAASTSLLTPNGSVAILLRVCGGECCIELKVLAQLDLSEVVE